MLKALVFKKLAKMLGGKLKATISGGGAISSEVQTFARVAFCAPAVQGYALTETCCSTAVQPVDDGNIDGVAGAPLTSIEIRLESCDITDRDGKPYRSTDTSHLGAEMLRARRGADAGHARDRGLLQAERQDGRGLYGGWMVPGREMWVCGAPTASCRSSID